MEKDRETKRDKRLEIETKIKKCRPRCLEIAFERIVPHKRNRRRMLSLEGHQSQDTWIRFLYFLFLFLSSISLSGHTLITLSVFFLDDR